MSDKIKELKEYLRKNLPNVKLEVVDKFLKEDSIKRPNNVAGLFKPSMITPKIIIRKDFEMNEKVLAHEIVHAVQHKYNRDLTHRDTNFWKKMENILGVDLFATSPTGQKTVKATMFKINKSGKYTVSCLTCGWTDHFDRMAKVIVNPQKYICPKCKSITLTSRRNY